MTISEQELKDPMYWIRWSVNSGILTGTAQALLYGCAAMCHPGVRNVEMKIDTAKKYIHYNVDLESKTYSLYNKFNRLRLSDGIISLWRLRRIVKKHGNLSIPDLVAAEVSRILGPEWTIWVDVRDVEKYADYGGDGQTG